MKYTLIFSTLLAFVLPPLARAEIIEVQQRITGMT